MEPTFPETTNEDPNQQSESEDDINELTSDTALSDDALSEALSDDDDDDDEPVLSDKAEEDEIGPESPNNTVNQDNVIQTFDDDDELESDDEMDEEYLQKFDRNVRSRFIENFHPQAQTHNYEEVLSLTKITRADNGRIIDSLHRTAPFLTKYEKTRILGQRAAQINAGAKPLVNVPLGVMQGSVIAELELKAKKIPFIIRRPLPNRGSEYWRLSDLEIL